MARDGDLAPYVPRLVFDWEADHPRERCRTVEGSLTFVDVSGFTAMSERLARLGKQGAEDVTDIISATFSELLGVAYEVDGSLLKFGGDALLLFFTGEEHARRACAAAVGMRRAMRRVGNIRTEAGAVRLRMSVGIHSGDFHLVLAGDSHRELVILGPETSRAVEMEHEAEAGEILVSAVTAEAVGERYLAGEKHGGRLLRDATIDVGRAPVTPVNTRGVDPGMFVPRAVRRRRADGEIEAEHRQATVAFVRFEGTDAIIAEEGFGAVSRRLRRLLVAVQRIVDRYDLCFLSTDVDADGGKIILLAGVPMAHEDDDERMLRAVREIAALDYLPLRIGVNKGAVFAGDIGPWYRRTYSVMGDTVNTAARVMVKAPVGAVLATEPVLQHSRTRFEVEELPPFAAKGKARPLVAFRVGAPTGRPASEPAVAALLGRDDELRALTDAVARALDGSLAGIEVTGEAGIGKSRLIEASLADVTTPSTVIRAEQYEAATAYAVVRRLLRPMLGLPSEPAADEHESLRASIARVAPALADDLFPLEVVLGSAPAEAEPPESARAWAARLERSVGALLEALLPDPHVVVIEDAQWLDQATSALLRELAPRIARAPWAFVVARRSPEVPLGTGETIELAPLDEATSVRVARASSPRPLLPSDALAIATRARGNPSFIRELAASFDPDAGIDALPSTLEATVAARLDALPPTDRMVLRHLSVLGGRFDRDAIAAVIEDPSVVDLPRLDEFLAVDGHAVSFRRPLYRDVAYAHLPFRLRRALHGRAGTHLEQAGGAPSLMALHFHEARDDERTWRYARAAADEAVARYAHPDAVQHFRRALDAARRLPALPRVELADTWGRFGHSLRDIGRLDDASAAYRAARRAAREDAFASARLCLLEADLRRRQGRLSEAVRWAHRGLNLLAGTDEAPEAQKLRLRLQQTIGETRYEQGRDREAKRWFRSVLEQAEAADDLGAVAHACNLLQVLATRSREPEGDGFGHRAVELYGRLGSALMQAQAVNNLAMHASAFRRWDEAARLYERACEGLEQTGEALAAAAVANNLGGILAAQGRLPEARAAFEEALGVFVAAQHAYRFVVLSNLAHVLVREGRLEESDALFAEAREGLARMGAAPLVAELDARLAERSLLEGKAQDAFDRAEALAPDAGASLEPALRRVAACALLLLGRSAEAAARLREAVASARRAHDDLEEALALSALAACGEEDAVRARDEATAICRRLGVVSVTVLPPGSTPAGAVLPQPAHTA